MRWADDQNELRGAIIALALLTALPSAASAEQALESQTNIETGTAAPAPDVIAEDDPDGTAKDMAEDMAVEPAVQPPALLPLLEPFVDGIVESAMLFDRIAGVQVAVVKDDKLALLKGYGLAAVDPARTVDPARSLFRIGSISKTFTWIALMQLVEQGKITLADPINDHLPAALKMPDEGFSQPIRIRDLMNHTSGLEDAVLGHLIIDDEDRLLPLHTYLARYRPHRVREPGEFLAYSNYGAALAGALVAEVSGLSFETYVERNILTPLGMTQTTFREIHRDDGTRGLAAPMRPALQADMAQGIEWRGGAWQARPYEFIGHAAPAGSAVSTAADMARYMRALLNYGVLGERAILDPETAAAMRDKSFGNALGETGTRHGFFEWPLGYDTRFEVMNFGHDGGTAHFYAVMLLVPDLDLGIFVAANSATAAPLIARFAGLVAERYFALDAETAALVPPADFSARARKYVGAYRSMRRSYTKLEGLLTADLISLGATDDGFLVGHIGGEAVRLVEVGPNHFRSVKGDLRVSFREDQDGAVTHLITPMGSLARIAPFDGVGWLATIAGLGAITAIGMVSGGLIRRGRPMAQSRGERLSARLMAWTGAVWLGFAAVFMLGLSPYLGPDGAERALSSFPSAGIKLALGLLLLAVAGTVLAVASLVPVWRAKSWPLWRRLRHTAAVAILVALTLTLDHWQVIGFRYF